MKKLFFLLICCVAMNSCASINESLQRSNANSKSNSGTYNNYNVRDGSAAEKYALVIGNGNYNKHPWNNLKNSVNDARDVGSVLQELGFQVDLIINGNLNQMQIGVINLKQKLRSSQNSYGFFFYAGHGAQNREGHNFLIPVDADTPSLNLLGQRTLPVQFVLDELEEANNELNMIVFDACRDVPNLDRSSTRGLSVIGNIPRGSIIMYATAANRTASDGSGRNGLFTSFLLNNLKMPGITVNDIFVRTGADVARATNGDQYPEIRQMYFEAAYLSTRPINNPIVQETTSVASIPLDIHKKYALVIGNGNYSNIINLNSTIKDANDMSDTLQNLGFSVDTLLDASLDQMEDGLTRLKNQLIEDENSYGFFYYAGHAVQVNGENYLIPVNANLVSQSYLYSQTLPVQIMLTELNDSGNTLNVIVLDACRDNPFPWYRSSSRGLVAVKLQPAGSIIAYATATGGVAQETDENGLFTSHLINNLKIPGLEVREVFRRTRADVARESNNRQLPVVFDNFSGLAYLGIMP